MRKLGLLVAAGLVAMPFAATEALADGKVTYKGGTKLSFPEQGVEVKVNSQLQPKYGFNANDVAENESEFSVRRARLIVSGSALDGDVSFKLQNDFVGDSEDEGKRDSDLLDAWVQWNASEAAQVRFGQFKTNFSRQELGSSAALQFVDRSIASDEFSTERQAGIQLGGSLGDIQYAVAATNGESEGEGRNRGAVDTDLLGSAIVAYNANGYDRSYEGDPEHTDGVAFTVGVGSTYGQESAVLGDQDTFRLGGDVGVRSGGASLQAEYYYRTVDPDGGSSVDDTGLYVQAGYFIVPKEWEIAGRVAMITPDSEEDVSEYTVGLGRFLMGHALKAQLNATWEIIEVDGGSDIDNQRYEFQVTAYI